eukprot:GAHX01001603.1.p1 GENE.GAHX01001603.1~~GAHX01001603.1.p1  ORF type:complete len:410 (+),score=57.52 GAHX01001603.1:56-1285(+)
MEYNKLIRSKYKLINQPTITHWEVFEEFIDSTRNKLAQQFITCKGKRLFTSNKNKKKVNILCNIFTTNYWVIDQHSNTKSGKKSDCIIKLPLMKLLKPKIVSLIDSNTTVLLNPSLDTSSFNDYIQKEANTYSNNNRNIFELLSSFKKQSLSYKVYIFNDIKIISVQTNITKLTDTHEYTLLNSNVDKDILNGLLAPIAAYNQHSHLIKGTQNLIVVFNYDLLLSLIINECVGKGKVITGIICLPFYNEIRLGFFKALNYLETNKKSINSVLTYFMEANPTVLIQTVFKTRDLTLIKRMKEIISLEGNLRLQQFVLIETLNRLKALLKTKDGNCTPDTGTKYGLMQEMIGGIMKKTFCNILKDESVRKEIGIIYEEMKEYKIKDISEDFKVLLNQFRSFLGTFSKYSIS